MTTVLEDKRENYQNFSVLCCVRQLCTMIHAYQQFLKMSVGLGLGCFVRLFRFSILCIFFWFSLDYFVILLFAFVVLGLVDWLGKRLRNDLFCIEWDIEP